MMSEKALLMVDISYPHCSWSLRKVGETQGNAVNNKKVPLLCLGLGFLVHND